MERSNPAYNEGPIEYPIPPEKSRSSKKKNENIDSQSLETTTQHQDSCVSVRETFKRLMETESYEK